MKRLEITKNLSNNVLDGFLNVDKPKNMTSNDLCQILKKRYNIRSCGHNGTLDPDATGVMVLAFGRACKLLSLLDKEDKTYLVKIGFGKLSDTLDVSGKIIAEKNVNVNPNDVLASINKLLKEDKQIPPKISAIKINGKKLYEYARNLENVDIQPRNVKLLDYKIIKKLYYEDNMYHIDLLLHVEKGYYIRSFARDLGEELNTYGIVEELRRIKIGDLDLIKCIPLEDILNKEIPIIPITNYLKYDKINISEKIVKFVLNGVTLYERNLINDSDAKDIKGLTRFILTYEGKDLAIYERQVEVFRPIFKY